MSLSISMNQEPMVTHHEKLEYLAQGFEPAVTAELNSKRCGREFRLLVQEDHGERSACPICSLPSRVHPFTGLCLTRSNYPCSQP